MKQKSHKTIAYVLWPSTTGQLVLACEHWASWGGTLTMRQTLFWSELVRWRGREPSHSSSALFNLGFFSVYHHDQGCCGLQNSRIPEVTSSLWWPDPPVMTSGHSNMASEPTPYGQSDLAPVWALQVEGRGFPWFLYSFKPWFFFCVPACV